MPFPSDVFLPLSAKYHGFVDSKTGYNSHWDITWSFTYALTGTEHAFCTFLTTNPELEGGIPGQYLGYLGINQYLLDENGSVITDEFGDNILIEGYGSLSSYNTSGILAIAFDSTGYFALSSAENSGVSVGDRTINSLIVRDPNNRVICNVALSSLDTGFHLASSVKTYQTMRFRLGNAGRKLQIDYRATDLKYINLTTLNVSVNT